MLELPAAVWSWTEHEQQQLPCETFTEPLGILRSPNRTGHGAAGASVGTSGLCELSPGASTCNGTASVHAGLCALPWFSDQRL